VLKTWFKRIRLTDPEENIPASPSPLKNRFNLHELTGALGDLGTLLPLAFTLILYNGYSPSVIFLLFGVVYAATGLFYKVPIAVQPLKAMAIIAITQGYSVDFLSSTSIFYGILLLFLSVTGLIKWIRILFTKPLIRGIQLGIGLILMQKAVQLVMKKGFLLQFNPFSLQVNIIILIAIIVVIWLFQLKLSLPVNLILMAAGVAVIYLFGIKAEQVGFSYKSLLSFSIPKLKYLKDALIFLIIPQLPLTLGNAVYAASDTAHTLWPKQAGKVNETRLAFSIGLSDILIGFLRGFPICHGSGGIGAHAQFGGKTGGTTIIIGVLLIITGVVPSLSAFIFLIPVPLLSAMLLFDSYRMVSLLFKLHEYRQITVAVIVGIISFLTRNLSIALAAGFIIEKALAYIIKRRISILNDRKND